MYRFVLLAAILSSVSAFSLSIQPHANTKLAAGIRGGEIGRGAKDRWLERSDSSMPPTIITNNLPLIASPIAEFAEVGGEFWDPLELSKLGKVRSSEERKCCCSYDGNIPYILSVYDIRPFNTAIGRND